MNTDKEEIDWELSALICVNLRPDNFGNLITARSRSVPEQHHGLQARTTL
jgi:hypothetical protein